MSSSIRLELLEMQAKISRIIASLPAEDREPAQKKRRRRGPRIVDEASLPGPPPSDIAVASARRLLRGAR